MRTKFVQYWKLMYFILLGHLLLLTSAVYENGGSEFSRRLVPRMSQVPKMLESLLASLAVLTVWAFVYFYIERQKAANRF